MQTRQKERQVRCYKGGYILNSLVTRLYYVYQNYKTPKEVYDTLESKYEHMKKGMDKLLALKYFKFIFSENMPIMDQESKDWRFLFHK